MSGRRGRTCNPALTRPLGTPNISDQDDATDVNVLAAAFVYARTGTESYRTRVEAAIKAAVGTEAGGRTLALARNLPGYVIGAALIDLPAYDASFDTGTFRPWLRSLLTETLDGMTLRGTHEQRPNNWGTHAGAARAAIALYLGDTAELSRTATVFRGWLGDRSAYAGFTFGDLSWQCNPSQPVAIDPAGCVKNGVAIDGALPDEMRRGGTFQWPPIATGYAWEGLQGAMLQADLLSRCRLAVWSMVGRGPAAGRQVPVRHGRLGGRPVTTSGSHGSWMPAMARRTTGAPRPSRARTTAGPTGSGVAESVTRRGVASVAAPEGRDTGGADRDGRRLDRPTVAVAPSSAASAASAACWRAYGQGDHRGCTGERQHHPEVAHE